MKKFPKILQQKWQNFGKDKKNLDAKPENLTNIKKMSSTTAKKKSLLLTWGKLIFKRIRCKNSP